MKNGFRKLVWLCMPFFAAFWFAGCDQLGVNGPVPVPAESVEILDDGLCDGLYLDEGRTVEIRARVLPEGAVGYELAWTVDDESIATVDPHGMVKGISGGVVTVTVTLYVDGDEIDSDRIELTVVPQETLVDPIDPYLLFDALRGLAVRTGGWADYYNGGLGIAYANPGAPIVICDESYPDPGDKLDAFIAALAITEPTFIIVSGDIDLSRGRITPGSMPPENVPMNDRRFDVNADTTIIGINDARLMFGGLRMDGRPGGGRSPIGNVIIRNIAIWDSVDYGLGLDSLLIRGAMGVWIDHVRFTSGNRRNANVSRPDPDRWHDDTLNIREGMVTVSWSEFYNLDRTLLSGSGDGETDREARRVTLHHNFFHNVRQRVPRTRGTQMHMYSNYFYRIGLYIMGPGVNSAFVVQNNLFDSGGTRGIVDWSFPNADAVVWSSGNVAGVGIAGVTNGEISTREADRVKPWEPGDFYQYTLTADVQGLRTLLPGRAGPTLETIADFLAGLGD